MDFKLGDITLGCADGENEAKEEWFTDLFYNDNKKVEEITLNKNKFIISGRKGTGKTILAKYIEKSCAENGVLTKVVNKNDFSMQNILEVGERYITPIELSHFIYYSILIQIVKLLVESSRQVKCFSKNSLKSLTLAKVRKFIFWKKSICSLKKLYNQIDPDSAFVTKSIEQINDNLLEANHQQEFGGTRFKRGKSSKESQIRKNYIELISRLEMHIFKALKYTDIYIFFDDLDELGSKILTKASTSDVFVCLLETVQGINNKLHDNGNHDSKCIVMMRTDILDSLNSESSNLNKLLTDCQVKLDWINESGNSDIDMLMDMILTKINKSCFFKDGFTNILIYKKLFPQYINKKSCSRYLLDFSFGRPRDAVTFLNIIISRNPSNSKFHPKMFTDNYCIKDYSNYFLKEIKNEMHVHFDSNKIESMFRLLKNFGQKTFKYSDIENYFNSNLSEYSGIDSIRNSISTLYKFGVLGNSITIVNPKSQKVTYKTFWSYREDGRQDPDFRKMFIIHNALLRSLI